MLGVIARYFHLELGEASPPIQLANLDSRFAPVAIVGGIFLVLAMFGWALEPSTAPETDFDPPASGDSTKELAPLV